MHKGQENISYEALSLDKETFLIDEIVNLAVIFYLRSPRFSPTKNKHLKRSDKYASLHLHSDY